MRPTDPNPRCEECGAEEPHWDGRHADPDGLRAENDALRHDIERHLATTVQQQGEIERLLSALKTVRSFVIEGGVPRYTVIPGAGLNSFIEEELDPLLRGYA